MVLPTLLPTCLLHGCASHVVIEQRNSLCARPGYQLLGTESLTTIANSLVVPVCWKAQKSEIHGLASAAGWCYQGCRLIPVLVRLALCPQSSFLLVSKWLLQLQTSYVPFRQQKERKKEAVSTSVLFCQESSRFCRSQGPSALILWASGCQENIFNWVRWWFSANKAEGGMDVRRVANGSDIDAQSGLSIAI